jgi:hypothetical protein
MGQLEGDRLIARRSDPRHAHDARLTGVAVDQAIGDAELVDVVRHR